MGRQSAAGLTAGLGVNHWSEGMQQVLISGASSGIGAEFARQFHARKAGVILVARRAELLQQLVDSFNAARPGSARFIAADLSSLQGLSRVEKFLRTERVDILVNNAGRGSFGFFDGLSLQEELQMVELNVVAYLRLAHAVIPQMKARRAGVIINISSVAAFQPLPFMATYAASKAFNFMHSLALRNELDRFGIRVLTVCPGPTDTEFGGVARVPGKLTGVRRDRAADVVRSALRAMDCNRAWVVPGLRSKLISFMPRFLPKSLSTWLAGKILYSTLKEVS